MTNEEQERNWSKKGPRGTLRKLRVRHWISHNTCDGGRNHFYSHMKRKGDLKNLANLRTSAQASVLH